MPFTGKDMGLVEYKVVKKMLAVRRKGKVKKIPVFSKVRVRNALAILALAIKLDNEEPKPL